MEEELIKDFAELEETLGEIDFDELAAIKAINPQFYLILVQKVINFLRFLSQVPIKDDDGNITHTLDLYDKIVTILTQNNKNSDGTTAGWVNWITWVFEMSKNLDNVIKKVESGDIA